MDANRETATLGGGCFWCLEPLFEALDGVEQVVVGYAGGERANPTYHEVGMGRTGHAEVVQINYDPERISYRDLLEVFFTIHDPTTKNRQGADVGPQYRSLILTHGDQQRAIAEQVISDLEASDLWGKPFVTEIQPFGAFYLAEDYHQDYYEKNPYAGYCLAVIRPKVAKFRAQHAEKLARSAPA